jgi:branched-chain amino acid transport system ATP-binding protein
MFAQMKRLHGDGLSILLVEQNVAQSLEIAHRAYVLENGAMTFHGTPGELLDNGALRRAYLGI